METRRLKPPLRNRVLAIDRSTDLESHPTSDDYPPRRCIRWPVRPLGRSSARSAGEALAQGERTPGPCAAGAVAVCGGGGAADRGDRRSAARLSGRGHFTAVLGGLAPPKPPTGRGSWRGLASPQWSTVRL